ncbi:unnamed protein product, partial [Staurois parvus]
IQLYLLSATYNINVKDITPACVIVEQGRTDNSWGPRTIGDHRAPVSWLKLKKAYEKGTRGISWGPY